MFVKQGGEKTLKKKKKKTVTKQSDLRTKDKHHKSQLCQPLGDLQWLRKNVKLWPLFPLDFTISRHQMIYNWVILSSLLQDL